MLLVIDIGNTNVVVGCIDGREIFFEERLSTDRKRTELEYAIDIKNVLEIYEIAPSIIEGAIISSVVPQITDVVRRAIKKLIDKTPKVVGPGLKTGLNIVMDQPAQLGSDLVVDAVAAMADHPVPLIIIDMGTATTVSVVDHTKSYIGGMILPGIRTATDSLVSNAAQLQQISFDMPRKLIGSNTIECMQSGALYGNAAAIDGLIDRIEGEQKETCTVVATGGLAGYIVPLCRKEIIVDNNLLLKGLQIIYNKNR